MEYEQRSDVLLTYMMGRHYTSADIIYYVAASAAVIAAGAVVPSTNGVRLPLLALQVGSVGVHSGWDAGSGFLFFRVRMLVLCV